jgi:hypothetical protein
MIRMTVLISTALLLIAVAVHAGEITVHHTAALPQMELQADGFHHFVSSPGPVWGPAGSPELPHLGHRLLLPPGEEIESVSIQNDVWTPLPGSYRLFPAQPPVPISQTNPPLFTQPDPTIYTSRTLHPSNPVEMSRTDFLSGHGIGSLSITSARWQPSTGRLEALTEYDLVVRTSTTARAQESFSTMLKRSPQVQARLERQVENAELSSAYGPVQETRDIGCHYLIITTAALQSTFQELALYRTSLGLQAEFKTVEEISTQYPGIDLQTKIRNCILDVYMTNWLEYVLLAGDADLVPERGLWAQMNGGQPNDPDPDIAADLYYSNLDGNWNADGDSYYGEPNDNPDLYYEVAIGRMCAGNATQAQHLIDKTIAYETSPVAADVQRGLMVGEDLDWQIWGSDLKEEIHLGSSSGGYVTVGFPSSFQVETLYETPSFHFNAMTSLLPLLNNGQHLINHMGHGDVGWVLKFSTSQINDNNCTNNGVNHNFYFAYSQACYSGSFDNRGSGFQTTGDCICETFTTIAHGAVGFVANSRFGWGNYYNTNGPSQYYDREFFDALFGENEYKLGWINADSKEDNADRINWASYWCYYETNLMGDPALEIWTAQPLTFTPVYAPTQMLGLTEFDVTVGVPGANVVVSGPNGVMGSGTSNAQGIATVYIQDPITTPGMYTLGISKHNYIHHLGSINFTNSVEPWPIYTNPCFIDTINGDGDGRAEPGETLNLNMTFQNVGLDTAENLRVTLTCLDNCVNVIQGNVNLGTLLPTEIRAMTDVFRVALQPAVSDSEMLNFQVTFKDCYDSTWISNYNILAHAPELQLTSWSWSDEGNHFLSPGDTATLQVKLLNAGSSETAALSLLLSTDNPQIHLLTAEILLPAMAPGDSITTSALRFRADPTITDPSVLILYVCARDTRQYQESYLMEIPIGGELDNMESGVGQWTHGIVTPTFADEWDLTEQMNHSQNGTHSWHCGSSLQPYSPLLDAGLVTGEFTVHGNHILRFWHWMAAQLNNQVPNGAYDGGIVEMSLNGGQFTQITPVGGYPKVITQSSQSGPFAPGTPCWSGIFSWQQVEFHVQGTGTARFRFRFGSDGSVGLIGWFIDDLCFFEISSVNQPQNLSASIVGPLVMLTWNTPAPGLPSVPGGRGASGNSHLMVLQRYNVYRSGILIDSVQALTYADNLTGQPPGAYHYQVTGVFDGFEGMPSFPASVEYLGVAPDNPASLPSETMLKDARPNPFNPETAISYDLRVSTNMRLEAFDLSGRLVATLVDGWRDAGYHETIFDGTRLACGIYFIRMQAGDYTGIRKIALIK